MINLTLILSVVVYFICVAIMSQNALLITGNVVGEEYLKQFYIASPLFINIAFWISSITCIGLIMFKFIQYHKKEV